MRLLISYVIKALSLLHIQQRTQGYYGDASRIYLLSVASRKVTSGTRVHRVKTPFEFLTFDVTQRQCSISEMEPYYAKQFGPFECTPFSHFVVSFWKHLTSDHLTNHKKLVEVMVCLVQLAEGQRFFILFWQEDVGSDLSEIMGSLLLK